MRNTLILILAMLFISPMLSARIINRRVKEAPKVCAVMEEDKLLSKNEKQVFGTLKHSVVIEDNVSVINDLGKKECQWSFEKLNAYGNVGAFSYYIDEYKNYIYPYIKTLDNKYTMLKISLATCEIEDTYAYEKLEFPKCEKPVKTRKGKSSKKKHVAKT